MINMYPLKDLRYPTVAECISPDLFRGKKLEEIARLEAWEGNRPKKLGELFKLEELRNRSQEDTIMLQGDMSKVKRIGACMSHGEILVNGDVGVHLGEEMKGGKITVKGNVAGWTGAMMKGGEIEIRGNAGDYLGAPYRGSREGMSGGKIIIHGNAGSEAGTYMKGGLIKIHGCTGEFVGFRMHGGTIYVQQDCAERAGACMLDGRIIVGGLLESVLPTFTIDSTRAKVKVEEGETIEGPLYVFLGDLAENGKGKLYVFKEKNPHLSHYEEFL